MLEKEVIQVPVWAGVLLEDEGRFLLVQEKIGWVKEQWGFPGGRVDVGDTIEGTAVKEAKEEAGFDVKLDHKIGIFQPIATKAPRHIYKASITGGELKIPEDELLDAKWMTKEEIEVLKDKLRGEWVLDAIEEYLGKR